MRINRDVDPARCLSCAQGRHLNGTGKKDRNTECVCTRCMGHERNSR
jgi:hypothetical protein